MIDQWVDQIEKTLKKSSTDSLYVLFFRLYEIAVVFLGLRAFFMLSGLRTSLSVDSMIFSWGTLMIECAFWTGLGILFAEVGFRFVQRSNIIGFWIGMALSVYTLFNTMFLLGIFGFYVFLNPVSQKKLLVKAPHWLKRLLTDLRINFIETN